MTAMILLVNIAQGSLFNEKNPLLLSSGMLEAHEAELRIILWFDNGKPEEDFLENLPEEEWVWQETPSLPSRGTGYTLAGYAKITQEREQGIYSWYRSVAKKVSRAGGIAYLDERVPEGMDIAQYALKQNMLPCQFAFTEGVFSLVGWQDSSLPEVLAGKDEVNIQIISKGYGQGKTALALPVLLEEF